MSIQPGINQFHINIYYLASQILKKVSILFLFYQLAKNLVNLLGWPKDHIWSALSTVQEIFSWVKVGQLFYFLTLHCGLFCGSHVMFNGIWIVLHILTTKSGYKWLYLAAPDKQATETFCHIQLNKVCSFGLISIHLLRFTED